MGIIIRIHDTAIPLLKEINKEKLNKLSQGIKEVGFMVQGEIKDSISGGGGEPPSVDTGRYMQSIEVDFPDPFSTIIYTRVEYAEFLEFGTSPHFIAPVNKKALRWINKLTREVFFSKGHMVAGIQPRLHFTNSIERMKPKIVEHLTNKIK